MISAILAGGKGVRLWPESTGKRPKQMCDFLGRGSLLTMSLRRLEVLGPLLVVCGDEQRELVADEQNGIEFCLLSEPMGRNTAAAVGLALAAGLGEGDEVIGFFPADHYIENDEEFRSCIRRAEELAQEGYLVTIGIIPAYAETGYGYIERVNDRDSYLVKAFHEKPDLATATAYVQNGNFFWNAGIFIATVATWMGLMEQHLPLLFERIQGGKDVYCGHYSEYPSVSIDYAIAEKCNRMAVLEGNFGWSDIGSWDALAAVLDQDEQGNARSGKVSIIECSGCL
ncbi:MAG: mannose-1-phosphate guanylyltransferase, partial [Syntrophomonas sp.]